MTSTDAGAVTRREQDIVRDYLPLVHHVVASTTTRLPNHVSADDLTSAAMLGLLQAVRGFDDTRGVPFAAYAANRIRGAVLDELRGTDWATRSLRAKARSLRAAEDSVGAGLGEAAAAAGLSVEEARQVRADVHRANVLSIDGMVSEDAGGASVPAEGLSPEGSLLDRERIGYLRDAVDLLPERLRHVVVGVFFEERTTGELARELGVTDSRISHMRSEAMVLLREALRAAWEGDGADRRAARATPSGVAARRRAAYCATVTSASDYRSRLDRPAPASVAVPA